MDAGKSSESFVL